MNEMSQLEIENCRNAFWCLIGLNPKTAVGCFGLMIATLRCIELRLYDESKYSVENEGYSGSIWQTNIFCCFGMRSRFEKFSSPTQNFHFGLILSRLVTCFGILRVKVYLYWIFVGDYLVDLCYYVNYFLVLFDVIYLFRTIFWNVVIFQGFTNESRITTAVRRIWFVSTKTRECNKSIKIDERLGKDISMLNFESDEVYVEIVEIVYFVVSFCRFVERFYFF
jgi:hypothetical protein